MPITLACVAINGAVICSKYSTHGSADCEILAERIPSEGFRLPINMMFVDARGEAWRAVISETGGRPRLLH